MNSLYLYRSAAVAATAAFLILSSGCVVAPDGAYYNNGGYAAYPGYYEPYGAYYGGWAPDYYVAPYRLRDDHRGHDAGRHFSHATPSIPSRSRSRRSG